MAPSPRQRKPLYLAHQNLAAVLSMQPSPCPACSSRLEKTKRTSLQNRLRLHEPGSAENLCLSLQLLTGPSTEQNRGGRGRLGRSAASSIWGLVFPALPAHSALGGMWHRLLRPRCPLTHRPHLGAFLGPKWNLCLPFPLPMTTANSRSRWPEVNDQAPKQQESHRPRLPAARCCLIA